MQRLSFHSPFALSIGCLVAALTTVEAFAAEPLQFNRDIRPILSNHCFQCHGPDRNSRKAGVRLDQRESALAPGDSGAVPIVPLKPAASELVRRIFAKDAAEAMPPADSGKPLNPRDKELLKRWIAEGAKYEKHWSLIPPRRTPPPKVARPAWPRNPIDNFILARLEQEGLAPSADAEPATIFRRLSLDLTGLPPQLSELRAFEQEMAAAQAEDNRQKTRVGNRANDAARATGAADRVYESWVDRLLSSPHFGERMASDWLDAARFADSNGYQVDRDREMSAWRDWVIDAFNSNESFDDFTIDQLAGDLLPNATFKQKIATGFHRNHMLNEEGGVIPEEFLVEYCSDRAETTATVWLAQTLNCARCHDHKFDRVTQRDFYSLYAFFNGVPEQGLGNYGAGTRRNAPPFLELPDPPLEKKIAALNRDLSAAQKQLAALKSGKPTATRPLSDRIAQLKNQIAATDLEIPTALVMQEMPKPRPTFLLVRGQYNKHGEEVTAATPAALPPMSPASPRNRLGLARWLVDPANPLPARVTVNRYWQSLFGAGLVRTAGDFGTQGEWPSHPELLDWLATEFVRKEWDVKAMLRLLVTSSTYRQSSRLTATLRERDPQNRWLARGPRFRLQAEFLRDQALAASGLLASRIGGPSVRPYHPPGLYEQIAVMGYTPGKGDDLYRRSLYTFWKRSLPNPGMAVFDMPFRETCIVRRTRSNTPLQALNLMNDPTYVEAARCLAERMRREGGKSTVERIAHGFQLVLARVPHPAELRILVAAHHRADGQFRKDPAAASGLLKVGSSVAKDAIEPAELAALTTVATTILNLDETVTKE